MRFLLALLLSLALTGCLTAGKRGGEQALAVYDLGPQPAQVAAPIVRNRPLAVEVRAPLWFDSMGIEYRLAYVDVARLREYARARWAGPPAQLIQQRLVQQLGLVAHGRSRASCVLRVDITEFSQIFESPVTSRAVLQGHLQWLDSGRTRLAEQAFSLSSPAPTADARGGVTAFSASIEQLTASIKDWEAAFTASGQLKGCGV